MCAVPLVEELLAIVSWPDVVPAAVGSNTTLSIADWLGLSVSGKLAPETEKPVPVIAAELTVTGEPPVEVSVKDCVAGEFRVASPKAMLLALMLSVGTAALSCRENVWDTVPALAVSVTA